MFQLKHRFFKSGYTLIESLVTLFFVAVLISLAVPAYQKYTIRLMISECVNGAAIARLGIAEYRQSFGAWPPSLAHAGIGPGDNSQHCRAVSNYQHTTGAFTIVVNDMAIDRDLGGIAPVMTPKLSSSYNIRWNCTRGNGTRPENVKYLPSSCRDG